MATDAEKLKQEFETAVEKMHDRPGGREGFMFDREIINKLWPAVQRLIARERLKARLAQAKQDKHDVLNTQVDRGDQYASYYSPSADAEVLAAKIQDSIDQLEHELAALDEGVGRG